METGIKFSKNYKLKINYKELFVSLGLTSFYIISKQPDKIISNISSIVNSISHIDQTQKYIHKLIFNSISNSLVELLSNIPILDDDKKMKKETFMKLFDDIKYNIKTTNIIINDNFFRKPKTLDLLKHIQFYLKILLKEFGISESDSISIANRLPAYFVFSLNQEWMRNYTNYKIILEAIDTPFLKSTQKELEWFNYSLWLQKQIETSIFNENFSILQIYIPLRAYHFFDTQEKNEYKSMKINSNYIIVDLMKNLKDWVENSDKDDCIRFIYGGPGSGKSVFSKMFAVEVDKTTNTKVLFIALQYFNVANELISSLNSYLNQSGFFSEGSFDLKDENMRLLIIFDGLDELSMQGKLSNEIARSFIVELEKKIPLFNIQKKRVMVLVTGRTITMQSSSNYYDKDKRYLRILPYKIFKEDFNNFVNMESFNIDQRNIWWKEYGSLVGKNYSGIPNVFNKIKLAEITSQPLLNYLVALSFIREKINFSKETNLNMIYSDLIEAVYDRNYALGKAGIIQISNIRLEHFFRILEEISITTWHGKGRTTTIREIEEHFENTKLKSILDDYMKISEGSVVNLLTAFYFQQSGNNFNGEKTFEFTHKTFREYLTSKRIVQFMLFAQSKYNNTNTSYDDSWDEKIVLKNFLQLFGPRPIDFYLFNFIKDELSLTNSETVKKLQEFICILISYSQKKEFVLEKNYKSLRNINESINNTEVALFILLSACSNNLKRISKIEFDSSHAMSIWISKINNYANGINANYFYFDFMNLENMQFNYINLSKSNFGDSIISDCNYSGVNFDHANFANTNIEHDTHFRNSEFWYTDFTNANIRNTTFVYCSFKETIFDDSTLNKVTFQKCLIEDVIFKNVNLKDCKFIDCMLTDQTLKNLQMRNAIIERFLICKT